MAGTPYLIGSQKTGVGGNGAKFGSTIARAAPGQTIPQTMTAWANAVTPIEFCKVYFGADNYPTSLNQAGWSDPSSATRLSYCIQQGIRVALCYKPTVVGTVGPNNLPTTAQYQADLNSMTASINAFKTAGMKDWKTVTWQEQGQQHAGFPTPAQFQAVCNFDYQPLRSLGGNFVVDMLSYQYQLLDNYFPGPVPGSLNQNGGVLSCDEVSTDRYGDDYQHTNGTDTGIIQGFAALNNIPGPGIYEMGNSVGGNPPQSLVISYLSADASLGGDNVGSCEAQALLTKAAGLTICDSAWYENASGTGANIIDTANPAGDYRVAILQQLAASVRPLRLAIGVTGQAVGNGDTIWVFALASAGTVTGVSDTQGNTYQLADKEQGQSGCTLWTFVCYNAQPATGSGNALKKNPMDVIKVDYSSSASVQAAIAVGDTGVTSLADIIFGQSGNSTTPSAHGTPAEQPENAICAFGSLVAGGVPTIGGSLTQLAQIKAGNVAYLTAGWRTVTAITSQTVQETLSPAAAWSAVLVTDPALNANALAETAAAADALAVNPGTGQVTEKDAAAGADALAIGTVAVTYPEPAGAVDSIVVTTPSATAIDLEDVAAAADFIISVSAQTTAVADSAAAVDGIQVFTAAAGTSLWVLTAISNAGDMITLNISPSQIQGINIEVGQTFQLHVSGGGLVSPAIYTITGIG